MKTAFRLAGTLTRVSLKCIITAAQEIHLIISYIEHIAGVDQLINDGCKCWHSSEMGQNNIYKLKLQFIYSRCSAEHQFPISYISKRNGNCRPES